MNLQNGLLALNHSEKDDVGKGWGFRNGLRQHNYRQ